MKGTSFLLFDSLTIQLFIRFPKRHARQKRQVLLYDSVYITAAGNLSFKQDTDLMNPDVAWGISLISPAETKRRQWPERFNYIELESKHTEYQHHVKCGSFFLTKKWVNVEH